VRHATPADLEAVSTLLAELRAIPGLVERSPGTFYWRSRAFCHFHHDPSGMYVDAKLDGGEFERLRVTTAREQTRLLARVRRTVRDS
jgi:hypothetical protein